MGGKAYYVVWGEVCFDVGMGVSKPTEMTIRDLLQEELRKRGVSVVPEFSVTVSSFSLYFAYQF